MKVCSTDFCETKVFRGGDVLFAAGTWGCIDHVSVFLCGSGSVLHVSIQHRYLSFFIWKQRKPFNTS